MERGAETLEAAVAAGNVDNKMGGGLCGHAPLHCHVGRSEGQDRHEARVPLPWLTPADALDWVLTTADPCFEPSPWSSP